MQCSAQGGHSAPSEEVGLLGVLSEALIATVSEVGSSGTSFERLWNVIVTSRFSFPEG